MRQLATAVFAAACLVLPVHGSAVAQGGVSATAAPAPGTAQRRAILDALRPAIERRVGPDVEFVVTQMRVGRGWAFVMADPQRRGGRPIDGARYFPNFDEMDGLTVTAIFNFQGGRWRLVDHAIGATDAWYCGRGPSRAATGC